MWAFLYIFILGDIPEQQFEFFLWVNLGFCSYCSFFKIMIIFVITGLKNCFLHRDFSRL